MSTDSHPPHTSPPTTITYSSPLLFPPSNANPPLFAPCRHRQPAGTGMGEAAGARACDALKYVAAQFIQFAGFEGTMMLLTSGDEDRETSRQAMDLVCWLRGKKHRRWYALERSLRD